MTACEIIESVKSFGASLAVIDGKLKGKNLKFLDNGLREQVKSNKSEIIQLLTGERTLAPDKDKSIPFIDNLDEKTGSGCLVIPFGCPDKYKY